MSRKNTVFCLFAVFALCVMTAQSQAAIAVGNLFQTGAGKISDNSGEFLFNCVVPAAGQPNAGSVTTLEVGDIIITGFNVATIEYATTNDFGGPGNTTVDSLNGLSVIQCTGVDTSSGTTKFTFAPVNAAGLADLKNGVAGANPTSPLPAALYNAIAAWAPGTMIALYENTPANSFTRVTTDVPSDDPANEPADLGVGPWAEEDKLLSSVYSGNLVLQAGFAGTPGADEFWSANSSFPLNDFTVLANLPEQDVGQVNFGLDLTAPTTGSLTNVIFGLSTPVVDPVGLTSGVAQVGGNGNLQGLLQSVNPNVLAPTPFDAFDDLNANFNDQVVPEPLSAVVWGGLLGMAIVGGWLGHRRKA